MADESTQSITIAAAPATVLVAASVVVTAIGCPLIVAWYAKRLKAKEVIETKVAAHAV